MGREDLVKIGIIALIIYVLAFAGNKYYEQKNPEMVEEANKEVDEIFEETIGYDWVVSQIPEEDLKSVRESFGDVARPEISISYKRKKEKLEANASRIGGNPSVPADFVWPEYTGYSYNTGETKSRPLSFLAQINLKDVAPYDEENVLPKEGMLSFFYELDTMTSGLEVGDKGSAKVFYFPDTEILTERIYSKKMDQEWILPEIAVEFEAKASFPDHDLVYRSSPDDFEEDDSSWMIYDALVRRLGGIPEQHTKLLGYPQEIQGAMERDCELISRGYDYDSPVTGVEKLIVDKNAETWKLLFQMDSIVEDDFYLEFGDGGMIYFWIKEDDLKNCNFDDAWLMFQCY